MSKNAQPKLDDLYEFTCINTKTGKKEFYRGTEKGIYKHLTILEKVPLKRLFI